MIGFIGRENDVEFRILQIEPREVARKIIVGEQRIGAQAQEFRKCRIAAEICRCAQIARRRFQKCAIGDVVGNCFQFARMPADDRELIVDRILPIGMLFDVLLASVPRVRLAG